MDDESWIDVKQRKPTEHDADVYNCVLFYHEFQGAMVTGWHQYQYNRFFTHWRPTPPPPACYLNRADQTKK